MRRFIIFIVLVIILCSCTADKPSLIITNPSEYVNHLASEGYVSIFQSYAYRKSDSISAPFAGIAEFKLPKSLKDMKGSLAAAGGSETIPGLGLVVLDLLYFPMPVMEYNQLTSQLSLSSYLAQSDVNALNSFRQLSAFYSSSAAPLFSIYGIRNNGSESDLRNTICDIFTSYGGYDAAAARDVVDNYIVYPAGSSDDYNFYLVDPNSSSAARFADKDPKYFEEYNEIVKNIPFFSKNFSFIRPLGLTEINSDSDIISFETNDLYGNPVNSSDLFSGHKVTMINIWSTTCAVCLTEMPELDRLNEKYSDLGGQIIGLLYDGDDPEAAAEGKEFIDEYGIRYTNLIANKSLKDMFPTQSFPMTYFVDNSGKLIGSPVVGASIEKYIETMGNLLGITE